MGAYALLRWIEEPPKWDVVPVKDVKGPLEEGARVEAKFERDMFPAIIVKLGSQAVLNKAILTIIDDQPQQLAHKSDMLNEQSSSVEKAEKKKKTGKSAVKENERARSKAVLELLDADEPASSASKGDALVNWEST
ncbi:uncharacterized protein LOC122372342 [Amphibalanus amphitrite]|uniref:uncharacterized protein LOC122372342 n=1 Tax=Amphibalanus amphitrite TaxID=1232801 RepID=UPI001C9056A5|nr:uncharacterized protein LOC122372342 [Amphibalanus amphitrite]